jgi:ABC-type lipoprotein release transport system permease subunit
LGLDYPVLGLSGVGLSPGVGIIVIRLSDVDNRFPNIANGAIAVKGGLPLWQLLEVSPNDPPTLGVVAVILMGVAVVAILVPARRASRVDPVEVLRAE